METKEYKICANCKYFWGAFGYFDEMSRCTKRNIPTQDDSTCVSFTPDDNFYTDINDDDEQRDIDDDSSEFNFY